VILFFLSFILGIVISGAISVGSALTNMEVNLRQTMRPIVSFQPDLGAMDYYYRTYGVWPLNPTLTPDTIRQIATLPSVNQVNYSVFAYTETARLQGTHQIAEDETFSTIRLNGTSEIMPIFMSEDVIELIEGRVFTDGELSLFGHEVHPVIVSQEMAEIYHLSVDSQVEFEMSIFSPVLDAGGDVSVDFSPENLFASETFIFEIIGIFEPVIVSSSTIGMDWFSLKLEEELLRTVFTTNITAEVIQGFQSENYALAFEEQLEINGLDSEDFPWHRTTKEVSVGCMATAIIELSDVNDIEAFKDDVQPLLPELMEVEDLENSFDNIYSAMTQLQEITSWILTASIGFSLLIFSLLIVLFLRDRRTEVGIYLALGEKKIKIIFQILFEVFFPTIVGITLALFAGNVMSGIASRHILRTELASAHHVGANTLHFDPNSLSGLGLRQEVPHDEVLELFNISMNMEVVTSFYIVSLVVIIISTTIPMLYIIKSNPKKVLTSF